MKKLVIYCDMDGVLADFNAEPNAVERFKNEKGFFRKLKPIVENVRGFKQLFAMGYEMKILTTSPHARADRDKRLWLKEHLPFVETKNIIYGRPNIPKIDYVKEKNHAVLIDDWGQNIRQWLNGGGLHAIKITQELKDIEIDYTDIKTFADYLKGL